MRVYSLMALVALAGVWMFYPQGPAAEDQVIAVSTDDAAMNAAMAKARGSLPGFWAKHASPASGESDFSLKLGLEDKGQVEHFWCADVQGDAANATCAIANEPVTVKTVRLGQRITVEPAKISDWMYRKDGKIKGGETIRVLIATMPAEQADAYRGMLAD